MTKGNSLVKTALLAVVLLVLTATSAFADVVTFTGTTAGPTFHRPVANGNSPPVSLSAVGTAVPYSVTQLTVGTNGMYTFQCTATNPPGWDNYTFLYQNSFNAGAPLTNVLIGNDDNPSIGLSGFSLSLNAGTTYFFIVSGFQNTDFGAWSTVASGPGTITIGGAPAVPEPVTMLLLGTGLAGLGVRLRRRRTSW